MFRVEREVLSHYEGTFKVVKVKGKRERSDGSLGSFPVEKETLWVIR